MLGKLLERLYVSITSDVSGLTSGLRKSADATTAATNQMANQWNRVGTAMDAAAIKAQRGFNRTMVPADRFGRSVGRANQSLTMLGFQLNDIGVSMASGMNPFLVMVQQGAQIQQIYGSGGGGVNALVYDLGRALRALSRPIMVLAALGAGFSTLENRIQRTTDVNVTFMDTVKATFKVAGRAIWDFIGGPATGLWRFMGDMWNGIVDGIIVPSMNRIIGAMVFAFKASKIAWANAGTIFDALVPAINVFIISLGGAVNLLGVILPKVAQDAVNLIVSGFDFAGKAIAKIFGSIPNIMKDAIAGAVNVVIGGVENMVNGAIDGLRDLLGFMDKLPAKMKEMIGIDKFLSGGGALDLSDWKMEGSGTLGKMWGDLGELAAESFSDRWITSMDNLQPFDFSGMLLQGAQSADLGPVADQMRAAMDEAFGRDYMGEAFDAIKDEAVKTALARIAAGMEDVGGAAKKAAEEVKEAVEEMKEKLQEAADDMAAVFGGAFERLAKTGKFSFSQLLQDFNSLIIESVSKQLQQELSKVFLDMMMGSSGSGGGNLLGSLFSGIFGGGRAGGGMVPPWKSFIAGERGTELVSKDGPGGAYRVTPAGRTNMMMQENRRSSQSGIGAVHFHFGAGSNSDDVMRNKPAIETMLARAVSRGQRNL